MTRRQNARTSSGLPKLSRTLGMPPLMANLSCSRRCDVEDVVLVAVEDDAAVGQFAEGVEVMVPFAFGVEQRLVAVLPEFLDDRLERRPVVGVECLRVDERHAAAVHPEADGHEPAGSAVVRPTWHRCGMSASQAFSTLSGCVCMSIVRPT